jgi:hypothetical protein
MGDLILMPIKKLKEKARVESLYPEEDRLGAW